MRVLRRAEEALVTDGVTRIYFRDDVLGRLTRGERVSVNDEV
jgi:hypothetical protein